MGKFYVQSDSVLKQLIHFTVAILLLCTSPAQAQDAADDTPAIAPAVQSGNDNANPASDAEAPGPVVSQSQWMKRYMDSKPARGALWLGEGEDAFVALFRKAVDAKQIGVILLADRPSQLAQAGWRLQLYRNLPLHGWSVLMALMPENMPGSSPGGEEQSQSRIAAAGKHLQDHGARSFALIADRLSAMPAVQACITNADQCSGLVLWRIEEKLLYSLPLEKLKQSRVSVLDVLGGQPDAESRLARKHIFRAAGFDSDYQAMVFPAAESPATNAIAGKRLRSWLDTTFTSQ